MTKHTHSTALLQKNVNSLIKKLLYYQQSKQLTAVFIIRKSVIFKTPRSRERRERERERSMWSVWEEGL